MSNIKRTDHRTDAWRIDLFASIGRNSSSHSLCVHAYTVLKIVQYETRWADSHTNQMPVYPKYRLKCWMYCMICHIRGYNCRLFWRFEPARLNVEAPIRQINKDSCESRAWAWEVAVGRCSTLMAASRQKFFIVASIVVNS